VPDERQEAARYDGYRAFAARRMTQQRAAGGNAFVTSARGAMRRAY
jgi:hypothetical protein